MKLCAPANPVTDDSPRTDIRVDLLSSTNYRYHCDGVPIQAIGHISDAIDPDLSGISTSF